MKFVLKNNVDKNIYTLDVNDIKDSAMFYHFKDITLPSGIPDGDYNYYLYDKNDKLVAEGICQIGNYQIKPQEHTVYTNNNNYIQYQG